MSISRLALTWSELTFQSDDEEDETAELMRELEKIKKERAEQREKEVGRTDSFRLAHSSFPHLGTREGSSGTGATRT